MYINVENLTSYQSHQKLRSSMRLGALKNKKFTLRSPSKKAAKWSNTLFNVKLSCIFLKLCDMLLNIYQPNVTLWGRENSFYDIRKIRLRINQLK